MIDKYAFQKLLLRFTNLVRLIRLLGRSYRSDEAGDGPATQVVCNGRGGQECRSLNRPALVHVKGTNKKTGEKEYRSWCKACHLAKTATQRCPPTKPEANHIHLDGNSIHSESEMDSMGDQCGDQNFQGNCAISRPGGAAEARRAEAVAAKRLAQRFVSGAWQGRMY